MDQIKIGKFLQQRRKECGLTQSELAEKLCVSDRAISKWENGNCLPDADHMIELCDILGITINDPETGVHQSFDSINHQIPETNVKRRFELADLFGQPGKGSPIQPGSNI